MIWGQTLRSQWSAHRILREKLHYVSTDRAPEYAGQTISSAKAPRSCLPATKWIIKKNGKIASKTKSVFDLDGAASRKGVLSLTALSLASSSVLNSFAV